MSAVNVIEIINAIAAVINTAVQLGPRVVKTVEDARPFAQAIHKLFEGDHVSQQQLEDLHAQIKALSAKLQAPLPLEEGDGA